MSASRPESVEIATCHAGARVVGCLGRFKGKPRYQLTLVRADGSTEPMPCWVAASDLAHPVTVSLAHQHASRFLSPAGPVD
jgi:hypothetical protein